MNGVSSARAKPKIGGQNNRAQNNGSKSGDKAGGRKLSGADRQALKDKVAKLDKLRTQNAQLKANLKANNQTAEQRVQGNPAQNDNVETGALKGVAAAKGAADFSPATEQGRLARDISKGMGGTTNAEGQVNTTRTARAAIESGNEQAVRDLARNKNVSGNLGDTFADQKNAAANGRQTGAEVRNANAEAARGKVEVGTPAPQGAETADSVRANPDGQKVLSEVKAGKAKNIGSNITKAASQLDRDIAARQAAGENVANKGRVVIEGQPGQHVDDVAKDVQRHVPGRFTPPGAPEGTVVDKPGAVGSANHDVVAQDDQGRQKVVRPGDGTGADPRSNPKGAPNGPLDRRYPNAIDAANGHANKAMDAVDRVGARVDQAKHVISDATGITKANQKIADGLVGAGRTIANSRAGQALAEGTAKVVDGVTNSSAAQTLKNATNVVTDSNAGRAVADAASSSTARTLARGGAKLLAPAALALDAYNINNAYEADQARGDGDFTETKKAVGEAAGGWAGAASGAAIGAAVGSAVPVVGTAVGAVVGAVAGGLGGGWLGRTIGGWF